MTASPLRGARLHEPTPPPERDDGGGGGRGDESLLITHPCVFSRLKTHGGVVASASEDVHRVVSVGTGRVSYGDVSRHLYAARGLTVCERAQRFREPPLALRRDGAQRRERSLLAGDAAPLAQRVSFPSPRGVHPRRQRFQRVAREPAPLRDDNHREALAVATTREDSRAKSYRVLLVAVFEVSSVRVLARARRNAEYLFLFLLGAPERRRLARLTRRRRARNKKRIAFVRIFARAFVLRSRRAISVRRGRPRRRRLRRLRGVRLSSTFYECFIRFAREGDRRGRRGGRTPSRVASRVERQASSRPFPNARFLGSSVEARVPGDERAERRARRQVRRIDLFF